MSDPPVASVFSYGTLTTRSGKTITAAQNIGTDISCNTNCHGLTFTGGDFLIDNAQVPTLLEGEGYKETSSPKVGDIVVYVNTSDGKTVRHSATVSGVDADGKVTEVAGLGGAQLEAKGTKPEPGPNGGFHDPNTKPVYYARPDDKRSTEQRRKDAEATKAYRKREEQWNNRATP